MARATSALGTGSQSVATHPLRDESVWQGLAILSATFWPRIGDYHCQELVVLMAQLQSPGEWVKSKI